MSDDSRSWLPPILFAGCLLAGVLQPGLLWLTDVPLGVPGEWTWARSLFEAADLPGLLPAVVVGALLAAFTALGGARIGRAGPLARSAWIGGLCLLGFLWLFQLVSAVPGIAGASRFPFVLYYPRTSGYFFQARYDVEDLPRFLAGYREAIDDSDDLENYLHIGTHPPGLTTAYRLLIDASERVPWLVSIAERTQPPAVREGFDVLRMNDRRLRRVDLAVLWWGTILTLAAAAGTVAPLFCLLKRSAGDRAAWWGASLWLSVPAAAVFLPKSDVLFPFLAMLMQWQWLESLDRNSFTRGALAGTLFAVAMLLSLAFVPLGIIFALQFCVRFARKQWNGRSVAGALLPLLVLIILCLTLLELNLVSVWLQNVRNHASFFVHNTRTWWAWLLVNPVELACSLGLPLAVCAVCGLVRTASFDWRRGLDLFAAVAVWGLLWLSGKNMGEAARLWIFLMPYAVWLAAPTVERMSRSRWWLGIVVVQLVTCLLTVARIDGFHFAELLP